MYHKLSVDTEELGYNYRRCKFKRTTICLVSSVQTIPAPAVTPVILRDTVTSRTFVSIR